MYKNKFLTGTEINLFRVFKIISIFASALLAFAGGNVFAQTSWNGTGYIVFSSSLEADEICESNYNSSWFAAAAVGLHEIDNRLCRYTVGSTVYNRYPNGNQLININDLDELQAQYPDLIRNNPDGTPYSPKPEPSDCTLTSSVITLAGDQSTPSKIWIDGCQYNTGGVSACTTSDSWVTKQCSSDISSTGEVREIDQTCTVENPCIAEPEEQPTPVIPSTEQIDTAAEGESHPDYDLPTNTEPDITFFETPEGTMRMEVQTSDGCTHDISIDQDGYISESITGSDCQAIIYQQRDYGNDNIQYSPGTNPPPWYEPSSTNDSGSTGGTDSTPDGITPTPNSNDVDIDTNDTPETICDPSTQDCSGLNTGLLSDIKELLSFDDQTPITNAATEFDTNLQSATDELEALGAQDIEIDGFNIDSLIKDVLRLPTSPPNQSNTFTLTGDFHIGTKSIEITNMYEKLSMLRTFLKWVFWITAVFSCYKILFSRPLM